MLRKGLLVLLALMLAPLLVSAYTVVLKNGQRIEAQRPHTIEGNMVKFVGTDGRPYSIPLNSVDLEATERVNAAERRPKVWTNEDLKRLSTAPVSVVGSARRRAPSEEAGAAQEPSAEGAEETGEPLPPQEETTEYWQEKLRTLYEEQAQIDEQMQRLRSGRNQAASNAINVQGNALGVQVEDTIQRLERRKQEIQQQIRDVQRQAERHGIPPGKLRRNAVMKSSEPQ